MAPMHEIRLLLEIPAHDYLAFYRGAAREVVVRAVDGRVVRFPADLLRPFVTREGISGLFALRFDGDHRFVAIERVGGGRR